MTNYREDKDLMNVLLSATNEDIGALIDIITDNGKGRISLDDEVKDLLVQAKTNKTITESIRYCIAEEIQRYGGNSIVNFFRSSGVLYHEIVCDAADRLKVKYGKEEHIEAVEIAILLKVLEKSLDKMSEDERKKLFKEFGVRYRGLGPAAIAALQAAIRANGFAAYKLAVIVANSVARALLGRGLAFGAMGPALQGMALFAGPVGWAITGLWLAFDLASPAYRVTIPCVLYIAFMRQKMNESQQVKNECPSCHAVIEKRFCGECGYDSESEVST